MWLSLKIAKKPLVFHWIIIFPILKVPFGSISSRLFDIRKSAKPSHGDLKGWPGLGPGATCLGGPKRRDPNAFLDGYSPVVS